jgi:single-stranded-DNA-specific exonuclease
MQPRKLWISSAEPPELLFREMASVPAPIVRALYRRGIHDAQGARAYFDPDEEATIDPFQLSGMAEAVQRVIRAVRQREPIVIYGDYDADGVTATAMLTGFLCAIGAEARSYIPSRFEEGYGLHAAALAALQEEGARLVISVDCGARSLAEAAYARSIGLDLIITDHHAPGQEEPEALAFVDPKRAEDRYPDKDLAGVGVAYKLVQALSASSESARTGDVPAAKDMLDLVALGTVADMVPLRGENRSLVRAGLAQINRPPGTSLLRPGLEALLQTADVKRGCVSASAIGFMLAPRLNAAGRLETATCALQLLLAADRRRARELAADLSARNRQRQDLARETFQAARRLIVGAEERGGREIPILLMAEHADFNPGVIGLAASRLTDEFYRPSVVVAIDGESARGSARSIPGFHITEALDSIRHLFERYGGHAAAAGFSLPTERLPLLRQEMERLAEAALSERSLQPELAVDSEVALEDLTWDMHAWIQRMEPCGQGNSAPLFVARRLAVLNKRVIGKDSRHLKLTLADGRRSIDAIAFGRGGDAQALPARMDVAFALEEDNYFERKLQMRIVDMAEAAV